MQTMAGHTVCGLPGAAAARPAVLSARQIVLPSSRAATLTPSGLRSRGPRQRSLARQHSRSGQCMAAANQMERAAPPRWTESREVLLQGQGVRSVNSNIAQELVADNGYLVIDVRKESAYKQSHIPTSVNVPLFSIKAMNTISLRRMAFALTPSVQGTHYNQKFVDDVLVRVGGNRETPILLVCDRGGDLESTPEYPLGIASNSLLAMRMLKGAGFTKLVHLRGGYQPQAARPVVSRAGEHTPSAWLLKIFYPNAEFGNYSTELMAVAFSLPFLVLGVLLYPRLMEIYSDYAYGLM